MPTPRTILVPVDFSAGSNEALKYATDLAKVLPRAEIVIMHAIEPMVFPSKPGRAKPAQGGEWWEAKVDENLKALLSKLKASAKLPVRSMIRRGRSYQEIARAAKEADADLIVMGSAGYTAQTYSQLGTTAERVARKAPCPVLLVREKGKEMR
jgi:nucleotide-binding universal stress UspA family protein